MKCQVFEAPTMRALQVQVNQFIENNDVTEIIRTELLRFNKGQTVCYEMMLFYWQQK